MTDVVTIEAFGHDYRIINPGPGRVGSKLANGEPYERKLLQDCYQLGLKGTAFDVGAHIGNHTLYLAAVCGFVVHAWEPYGESRAALEANIELNPGLDITVYGWAAGAEDGRARFTSGMWLEFDPNREGDKLTLERGHIPVHRIDDLVDVKDLAVVKIDVEGMEHDVVAGAIGHIERSRPTIYSETHTRTAHDQMAAVLEPLNYRVAKTIRMGSNMERWEHPEGPR